MSSPDASVVIAVLTYKRPERLKTLLPLLMQQAANSPMPASVLVIDNDPEVTARRVVQSVASDTVTYVSEPEPGIAAARNRALLEAQGATVLVFIDDDESPSASWLGALLDTYHRTGAAGVVGPVVSEFEVTPEEWIIGGGFFLRRRLRTGTEMAVAYTGNLLLDLKQISQLGLKFHPRFGLTGGEDTLFTRQIVRRGGKIVYCNEAVVTDFVPRDRSTRKWVLQRAFRSGNTWSQVSLELAAGGHERLGYHYRLLGSGLIRVLGGPVRFTFGVINRSVADKAKGLRTFARGAGMITGALGYSYQEYGRGSG